MPGLARVRVDDPDALAAALHADGACIIAGLPPAQLLEALRDDLARLHGEAALRPAGIGRGASQAHRNDIRGDAMLWLDDARCGAAADTFLAALSTLRAALNQRLFLGLEEVEAHYAVYPAGAGYARHRDRFRDDDARVLSLVSYLNRDWQDADGGALRLHLESGPIDIPPIGGGSVCFLSGIEHEVLPATRGRHSIAAWLRRRTP